MRFNGASVQSNSDLIDLSDIESTQFGIAVAHCYGLSRLLL